MNDWNKKIKVGSIVFNTYNDSYCIVTEINRRFLTEEESKYPVYKGMSVGEEYNPLITVNCISSNKKDGQSYDASFFRLMTIDGVLDKRDAEIFKVKDKYEKILGYFKIGEK